ncbi:MAG: hypothetical protein M1816_006687 [Peltula sp. TS41687]|nr:MAG: hypothetical protein M1816_006687 [Peltula sp. TS41687]
MRRPELTALVSTALVLGHVQAQSSILLPSSVTTGDQASTTSFRSIISVPPSAGTGAPLLPNIQDPQAVDPQTICPGYTASNVVSSGSKLTAQLSLAGKPCNVYGNDINDLTLTVEYQAQDRLHVEIAPTYLDASNATQYIIAENFLRKPTVDANAPSPDTHDLSFTWSNDPTFSFTVKRQSTDDVLFSTVGKKLVFEDQFLEFGSDLPEDYNIYGLGEVIHGLRLGNNLTRTIYNADVGDTIDTNLYGTHPFYLETRYYNGSSSSTTTSRSHGVYLRNAHGQEVLLQPEGIKWRTIGGIIDLYFLAGPTQPEVTSSHQRDVIGLPAFHQYYTLGYHQCRWGYRNWTELQEIVDDFEKFEIPLETIWTDIDYMNQYRDFDNDQRTFPYDEGQRFLQRLHESGRHYVPIVDAAIYIPNPENISDAYATFEEGNKTGVFLKNPDGSLYVGSVWPGYTAFIDFRAQTTGEWWSNQFVNYHNKIPFDGIWIDMNEVSSFCTGSCGSNNLTLNPVHPPFRLPGEPGSVDYNYPEGFDVTNATEAAIASSLSSIQASAFATPNVAGPTSTSFLKTTPTPGVRDINYPPYVINNVQGVDLAVHAVSPNATHADGSVEYDIHNLYGHSILNATYNALLNVFPGVRPFIIGRSTFAGSGMYAGHWGGDNYSKWSYMFLGIPQALSFSLAGIPMFGVDSLLLTLPQEPFRWASVAEASRKAMSIRYSILPYMYTLLYRAHTTGSTVMRALAWEFPNDPTLASVDRQFLLGPAIIITPVLEPGATTVSGVFPGHETWYDWYTQTALDTSGDAGENITLAAPLGHIPVHIRGGSVIPLQGASLTTRESRKNPWSVLVALDAQGRASGELYLDDGQSINPAETTLVTFSAAENTLDASISSSATTPGVEKLYDDTNPLANVTVMGVPAAPQTVLLNQQALAQESWSFDAMSGKLSVSGLASVTSKGAWNGGDWSLRWE